MYVVLKEINKPDMQRLTVAKGQMYSLLSPQHDSLGELKTVKQTFEFIYPFTLILGSSPPKFCSNFIDVPHWQDILYSFKEKI